MHLKQMFPKHTLDAEDLNAYSPTGAVVTIESLDYKTVTATRPGDAEVAYYLKVRELKKPFKLNKTNAHAIAQVLGTEDTDRWVGEVIRLMPIRMNLTDRATGKPIKIWTFDVDMMRPREAPALLPNTDITGMAVDASRQLPGRAPGTVPQGGAGAAMGELTPIGADKAADVAVGLSERARTLEDFRKHLVGIGLGGLVENKMPPQWPQAILPVARAFCAQLPKCAPPMAPSAVVAIKAAWLPPAAQASAPQAEVINRTTGEVKPVTNTAAAAGTEPADGYEHINEDDIPF